MAEYIAWLQQELIINQNKNVRVGVDGCILYKV